MGGKESIGNKLYCIPLLILLPYWISKWPQIEIYMFDYLLVKCLYSLDSGGLMYALGDNGSTTHFIFLPMDCHFRFHWTQFRVKLTQNKV